MTIILAYIDLVNMHSILAAENNTFRGLTTSFVHDRMHWDTVKVVPELTVL